MQQLGLRTVEIESKEMILDMTYDWHGKRLAIVTADRKIAIYIKTEEGKWSKHSEFTAHNGPIWKIKWAHEHFGNILATCRQRFTRFLRQKGYDL
jgi:WD40 repeat protein